MLLMDYIAFLGMGRGESQKQVHLWKVTEVSACGIPGTGTRGRQRDSVWCFGVSHVTGVSLSCCLNETTSNLVPPCRKSQILLHTLSNPWSLKSPGSLLSYNCCRCRSRGLLFLFVFHQSRHRSELLSIIPMIRHVVQGTDWEVRKKLTGWIGLKFLLEYNYEGRNLIIHAITMLRNVLNAKNN